MNFTASQDNPNSTHLKADYDNWVQLVPQEIREDQLWKVKAYRLSLYLSDYCWKDVSHIVKDFRTRSLADQMYRSTCSISTNIAEGYSRSSGRDQARFLEYALGSARESRNWYYLSRHLLCSDSLILSSELLLQIIKLLITMIQDRRKFRIKIK